MITHFTKDGKQLNTIKDVIINAEQFPEVYKVITKIEKEKNHEEKNKK